MISRHQEKRSHRFPENGLYFALYFDLYFASYSPKCLENMRHQLKQLSFSFLLPCFYTLNSRGGAAGVNDTEQGQILFDGRPDEPRTHKG